MPDAHPNLPALPSGSLALEAKPTRYQKGYYKRKATAVYELQMREFVVRKHIHDRLPFSEIAKEAVQSESTVRRYWQSALERHVAMVPFDPLGERYDEDMPWKRYSKTAPNGTTFEDPISGEVIDPPDESSQMETVLEQIQRATPTPTIARKLGITEREVSRLASKRLQQIAESENLNLSQHRQVMVMQIDAMIAALYAPATGQHPEQGQVAPILECVDRLMRLLKQKADLMGLSNPQVEDIALKLYRLAEIYSYDISELEEVAKDVLGAHRIKPLGRRVGTG